jgi:hypothetical protein
LTLSIWPSPAGAAADDAEAREKPVAPSLDVAVEEFRGAFVEDERSSLARRRFALSVGRRSWRASGAVARLSEARKRLADFSQSGDRACS